LVQWNEGKARWLAGGIERRFAGLSGARHRSGIDPIIQFPSPTFLVVPSHSGISDRRDLATAYTCPVPFAALEMEYLETIATRIVAGGRPIPFS
jgi:hypothetical protein